MGKWESHSFDTLISDETKNGEKIKKSDYLDYGLYPIIDQGQELIAGYTNTDQGLFRKIPAIIFGDHTRIIKYINMPFFLGADGVKILKAKRADIDYKFLYYYFKKNEIQNTGYNRHFKWLKELQIPLPPLEIQQKIAATLDTAAALLKLRQQQLAELEALIQSVFYEMFGNPVRNEKGWEKETIDKVCAKIMGGGTPSKSNSEYFEGSIPWVTPKDMKSIAIKDSIDHITEEAIKNSSAKLIPRNSILMVIRSGILKRTLPVAKNIVDVAINQDMKAFIVNEKLMPDYLLYFFRMMESNILKNVRAVTADNIEFSIIKCLEIPLPPLSLQTQFAAIVQKIEQQKALVQQSIDETQTLFDSLMSQYFD